MLFSNSVFVTIYEQPGSVSVLAPDEAVLTCQADGEPVPNILWFKQAANELTTQISESSANIVINETIEGLNMTSVLTISPTSALDSANYTCRAMNDVGGVNSTSAQVIVYGKLLEIYTVELLT